MDELGMKRMSIIAWISSVIGIVFKAVKTFLCFTWKLLYDSVRWTCYLFRAWRKSRKEISALCDEEQVALGKAKRIRTDAQEMISSFSREVASSRAKARSMRNRLEQLTREVSDCQKEFRQRTQDAASRKAEPELSKLRRQVAQAKGEATSAKNRCRESFDVLENRISEIESENLRPLENNAKELLNLLLTWIKTPRMQQGKTIANIFDAWWKDHYAGYLETADELNSRLSQLPDEFDDYTIQFKVNQEKKWLQPDGWSFDNDNNLVLSRYNNGGVPFTVQGLRSLLCGNTTDSYGNAVSGDMEVRLEMHNSGRQYRPLDVQFSISRNKELIVITMDDDGASEVSGDGGEGENDYQNGYESSKYGEEDSGDDEDGNDESYENDEDDVGGVGGNYEGETDSESIEDEDGYEDEDDDDSSEDEDDDDDGPEHEFDPTRKGSDLDQTFLETANDLFERLDELPKKCDRFKVRFVAANSDNWIQPEEWHLDDDDGSLIFGLIDDGESHDNEELTVADLKDILTGGRDDGDIGVEEDTSIYVDDPDSETYFRPLDEYFKILWKEGLVYIPMIESCGSDNDEDGDDEEEEGEECDGDYENEEDDDEDNEAEDEEESGEDDENYDNSDEKENEDDCDIDDNGDDDEDENDENDEEKNDSEYEDQAENGDDFARKAASGLVLGLMLENGRWRNKL